MGSAVTSAARKRRIPEVAMRITRAGNPGCAACSRVMRSSPPVGCCSFERARAMDCDDAEGVGDQQAVFVFLQKWRSRGAESPKSSEPAVTGSWLGQQPDLHHRVVAGIGTTRERSDTVESSLRMGTRRPGNGGGTDARLCRIAFSCAGGADARETRDTDDFQIRV